MNNNKKIITGIAILIVLILSIALFNKRAPEVMTTEEAATTTQGKMAVDNTLDSTTAVSNPSTAEYQNGTYCGIVKKSAIANGKLVLTIDFLQSFATHKETLIAAIEDDICPFPSNMGIKSKQEFLAKVKSLPESEIDGFIAKTSCFKNGITYLRNSNGILRSKDVAPNFIAYFPATASMDGISNTGSIETLNKILSTQGPANPQWQITIKDNKIVKLNQPMTP